MIPDYVVQVNPREQFREMQSIKVILTLWVRWEKPVNSVITFDLEDDKNTQNKEIIKGNNYIKVEMPFNSLTTEFF